MDGSTKSTQTRVGMIEINQVQKSFLLFPTLSSPANLRRVANMGVS